MRPATAPGPRSYFASASATFDPAGFLVPGRGFWAVTVPFFCRFDFAFFFVTLPTPQCARASAFFALASLSPIRFGTMHFVAAGVVGGGVVTGGVVTGGVEPGG